ncbi:hypothetical protein N6H14_14760 [Paenibacillus sp. CC-CFT747]|nr:hypothetical protein N6H14_14760 [Paenibacillus sp. CC-CFT747]
MTAELTGNSRNELSMQERRGVTLKEHELQSLLPYAQLVISMGALSKPEGLLRLTQNIEYLGDTVYTYYQDRIISSISNHLKQMNYLPSPTGIAELLTRVQRVGGEGLFRAITEKGEGGFSATAIQELLGLAVALEWYEQHSAQNKQVIISLDSYLAKRWLSKRSDKKRNDFLGIRELADGSYCIDLIEVKGYQATTDDSLLESHPVEQLRSVAAIVHSIVSKQGIC